MSTSLYRCTHYSSESGRCTADATHYLHDEDVNRVPGSAFCLAHAHEIIDEYRDKLGLYWSMEPIQESHNADTD